MYRGILVSAIGLRAVESAPAELIRATYLPCIRKNRLDLDSLRLLAMRGIGPLLLSTGGWPTKGCVSPRSGRERTSSPTRGSSWFREVTSRGSRTSSQQPSRSRPSLKKTEPLRQHYPRSSIWLALSPAVGVAL